MFTTSWLWYHARDLLSFKDFLYQNALYQTHPLIPQAIKEGTVCCPQMLLSQGQTGSLIWVLVLWFAVLYSKLSRLLSQICEKTCSAAWDSSANDAYFRRGFKYCWWMLTQCQQAIFVRMISRAASNALAFSKKTKVEMWTLFHHAVFYNCAHTACEIPWSTFPGMYTASLQTFNTGRNLDK